jgi:LysM repeat protein
MTERALPGMDGAPACPFVAFGDDREGRSTSPDHRHRCFAESPPAPRAVAHQEAYCLSSAFPVCPTFQDWARREAAHARGAGDRAETAPTAVASSAPLDRHNLDEDRDAEGGEDGEGGEGLGRPAEPPAADLPVRRNPPRDWAAPPPWATRSSGPPAGAGGDAGSDLLAGRAVEGQGLAGSAADRLAGGEIPAAAAWSASTAGAASTAPDQDLAGLVQPKPGSVPPARPPSDGYPPSTGTGRRPVTSTRPSGEAIPGPAWERMRRYEAYPTIKTRAGLPGMPGLPRVGLVAAAVAIAALALFMLPALLGIGGGGSGSPAPSGSRTVATAKPSPTVQPAPTPKVYIVKAGDNLGKIAKKFGVSIDEILAANPSIKNPNKISLGQEIVIPLPAAAPTAPPSGSAAP